MISRSYSKVSGHRPRARNDDRSDGGQFLAILQLVLKRSLNNSRLLLAAFMGLIIAVSLVSSVPLYTHGMLERLLRARLVAPDKRPPGTVWLRHLEDAQNHSTLDQF